MFNNGYYNVFFPLPATLRQVELVGLAGVQGEEEFEFEAVLPEDVKLRR